MERLKSQGFVLLILEGPADGEQVENVLQRMPVPPLVIRGADFLTVAGTLTYANVFIGHDSGVSHLSALMHVPTVVLFGPTDPSRWAPRGSHVSIVTGGAACRCTSSNFTVPCAGKECFPGSHEQLSEVCLALV
ncbi:hypothetical protein W02_14930 [Nitrospira sp. KM1]|nr:hypothetical protein W02_14930 [Nitrospira sp. KM1]